MVVGSGTTHQRQPFSTLRASSHYYYYYYYQYLFTKIEVFLSEIGSRIQIDFLVKKALFSMMSLNSKTTMVFCFWRRFCKRALSEMGFMLQKVENT